MASKLDRYVRNMSPEGREKGSGLNGSKGGGSDKEFRGFVRMKDAVSGITHGYNEQRTQDANKYASVEAGARGKSSMGTGGSSEYVKTSTSPGLTGKKGGF